MDVILSCFPAQDNYALCPPDLNSQNVLMDDIGLMTGLINWDLAYTVPPYLGIQDTQPKSRASVVL